MNPEQQSQDDPSTSGARPTKSRLQDLLDPPSQASVRNARKETDPKSANWMAWIDQLSQAGDDISIIAKAQLRTLSDYDTHLRQQERRSLRLAFMYPLKKQGVGENVGEGAGGGW